MAVISLTKFTGEIPKLPRHLLPDNAAQLAVDCDFSRGDLRPLRGGFLITQVAANTKSIFTKDGLTFFSWPTEVDAFEGPVINDQFNRVYYLENGEVRVTSDNFTNFGGGPPTTSFRVGSKPIIGGSGLLATERKFPGDASLELKIVVWYELGRQKYSETEVNPVEFGVLNGVEFEQPDEIIFTAQDQQELSALRAKKQRSQQFRSEETFTEEEQARLDELEELRIGLVPNNAIRKVRVTILYAGNENIYTLTEGQTGIYNGVPGGVELRYTDLGDKGRVEYEWGIVGEFVFAFTQVNQYGEESEPTVVATLAMSYIDQVQFSILLDRDPTYNPVKEAVLYQSNLNGTGLDGRRTIPAVVPDLNFLHSPYEPATPGLGTLQSEGYFLPPANGSKLEILPNGYFALAVGNDLHFSEPYRPHAWPYTITFPHRVTGLAAGEQQLLVLTTAEPYVVGGVHPDSVTQQRLPDIQAGTSKQGVSYSNGLLSYVSRDGVVAVNGSTSTLQYSRNFFTREGWRDRYNSVLSSMILSNHDGYLVGANPNDDNGFVMRIGEGDEVSYTQYRERIDGMRILPITDTAYYIQNGGVFEFGGGGKKELTWRSKEFLFDRHQKFGAAYINTDNSGPVELTLFADDEQVYTTTIRDEEFIRLPSGFRGLRWSIQFKTSAIIYTYSMAETMRELQRG